jgi:hypothetical protein
MPRRPTDSLLTGRKAELFGPLEQPGFGGVAQLRTPDSMAFSPDLLPYQIERA